MAKTKTPTLMERVLSGLDKWRTDAWENTTTGLGTTDRDKVIAQVLEADVALSDDTLELLYHQDDRAKLIVEARPREMLRQGFEVVVEKAAAPKGEPPEPEPGGEVERGDVHEGPYEADSETADAIRQYLERWGIVQKVTEGMIWGNLFGGALLIMGADDGQDMEQPLDLDRIRAVRYLTVLDKRGVRPLKYYEDPLKPKYGEIEVYELQPSGGYGTSSVPVANRAKIHESRVIRFRGALTSQRKQREDTTGGWDHSVLQNVYDVLRDYAMIWRSAVHLISDASQGVFTMKGFLDIIAQGKQTALTTRLQIMELARSVTRAIVIDADGENFHREPTPFTGLPEMLDLANRRMTAAARMPLTIFMGQSPGGLNATGESDIRWWYDTIKAEQGLILRPILERVMLVFLHSQDGPTRGKVPAKWNIRFPPLWQTTPTEDAALRAQVAQADAVWIGQGVLTKEAVARSHFLPEGFSPNYRVNVEEMLAEKEKKAAEVREQMNQAPPVPPVPGGPPPAPGAPPARGGNGPRPPGYGPVPTREPPEAA